MPVVHPRRERERHFGSAIAARATSRRSSVFGTLGSSDRHVRSEGRQAERMTGRVEQDAPTGVRLYWPRCAEPNGKFRRHVDVLGGQVQVNDRRPRPHWWLVSLDPLRHKYGAQDLDSSGGLLGPQLSTTQ
jgi:hypothetical protein